MTTSSNKYLLRLPQSLRQAVDRLSQEEGTSVNQFIVVAVAEKVAALNTETFFAERRARADLKEFRTLLDRQGGEPPRPGDEVIERP